MLIRVGTVALVCLLVRLVASAADVESQVAAARVHLQSGRYEQAADAYRELLSQDNGQPQAVRLATLGLSESLEARGLWDAAVGVVRDALEQQPDDPALLARLAELQFLRGDYAAAEQTAAAALRHDGDQLRARLVQAHVFTETGRLDAALTEYRWFVRYYNRAQPTDAESLLLVAEGSLQYARWKSVSSIFDFVINTLCPDALADDPHCWGAAHLSGVVLLEKYNRAQAVPELNAALATNPQAAAVLVSLGEAALQESELEQAVDLARRALAINPRLAPALRLAADVSLISGDTQAAMKFIEPSLGINPHDQRTLAQQATVFLLEDGIPNADRLQELFGEEADATPLRNDKSDGEGNRFVGLWTELVARNPKPGLFLTRIGQSLDGRRKYAEAEACFRRATALMPRLAAPRTELGMLLMRAGKLEDAAKILDEAFQADPYHVRVSNMRKVIRQLQAYAIVSSDHFVIRVPDDERVLGEEMSRYLEQTYDELTAMYGYEPETRTQFEVYGEAKGQSAHQWFSARMVGLPWVQTIGASTGMIVAMASPHGLAEPFNWARVVRHEFVHILTLQQTDFNIPHWYTEALAVRTEGAIPQSWDTLLLERVPAGEVFTLDDINSGFIRPEGPTDWNMAYCQSWLYARYIADRFGEAALNGLIDAYRRNLSTPEAIAEVCGVDIDEFEKGYTAFLHEYVDEIRHTRVTPPLSIDAATERWTQDPDDSEAWANVAWAMWRQGNRREAREMADEILAVDARQPLAVAILAEAELEAGRPAEAEKLLQSAFDAADPHPAILERLAKLRAATDDWTAARDLWEQGARRWPREPRFLRGLALALLQLEDNNRLREVLVKIAALDADNGLVRKKLAHMAFDAEDWVAAIRWGTASLHCDVRDGSMHRLLSEAYKHTGDTEAAMHHTQQADRAK